MSDSSNPGLVLYDPKNTALVPTGGDEGQSWLTRMVSDYGPLAVDVALDVIPVGRLARLGVSLGRRWLSRRLDALQKAGKPVKKEELLRILPVDGNGNPYVPEDQTAEVRKYLESVGLGGFSDAAHAQHIATIRGAAKLLEDLGPALPVIDRRNNIRARTPEEVVQLLAQLKIAAAPEMMTAYAEVLAFGQTASNRGGRRV